MSKSSNRRSGLEKDNKVSEETQTDPFAAFEAGPNAYAAMTKAEIKNSMDARYDTGNAYPNDALWIMYTTRS